jgi:sulfur carrier protein
MPKKIKVEKEMDKLKKFFFNGQKYQTQANIRLIDLIYYFNYKKTLFVLEYNNIICESQAWDKIYIKNNDKIEIITIVGGG